GDLTLEGASTWTGGGMSGTGTTTIMLGATLHVAGSNSQFLDRTLVNNSTALWSGAGGNNIWGFYNATLTNNGSFTVDLVSSQFFRGQSGSSLFNNAGTFLKQGAGTAHFDGEMTFNNSGNVELQAGTLRLASNGT